MRRLAAFFSGVLGGAVVGSVVALLFAPKSGTVMRAEWRARWAAAVRAGDDAASRKQAALSETLVTLTGPHPERSPLASQSSNGRGEL